MEQNYPSELALTLLKGVTGRKILLGNTPEEKDFEKLRKATIRNTGIVFFSGVIGLSSILAHRYMSNREISLTSIALAIFLPYPISVAVNTRAIQNILTKAEPIAFMHEIECLKINPKLLKLKNKQQGHVTPQVKADQQVVIEEQSQSDGDVYDPYGYSAESNVYSRSQ